MSGENAETADSFVQKNITITGLDILDWVVVKTSPQEIYRKIGRKEDPFTITIPYNVNSIESNREYLLLLCLKSTADIQRVHAKATLERKHPSDIDNEKPIQLLDDKNSAQIAFPNKPDAPNNFYHRWWIWPSTHCWREPDDYILRIWLGHNKYNPAPVTEKDWISKPITFNIKIKKEDPPKK